MGFAEFCSGRARAGPGQAVPGPGSGPARAQAQARAPLGLGPEFQKMENIKMTCPLGLPNKIPRGARTRPPRRASILDMFACA